MKHKEKIDIIQSVYMIYIYEDNEWFSKSYAELITDIFKKQGIKIHVVQDGGKVTVSITLKPCR